MKRKKVGILIFEDVEVLDFCGPFEVFTAVRMNEDNRREEASPFEPFLLAEKSAPVTTTGGMKVIPHYTLETCPGLDILVVPGGWGVRREIDNAALRGWLRKRALEVETLASVCTGSMLLGFAGLLDGLHATTHRRSLDWMRDSFPTVTVERHKRVVEAGNIITSAGISAGIDMALKLVARHCGDTIARATAKHMEYPYLESNARRT
ncbi:MAG: DJ-1/PfpI family protein [Syntrophobacteraceae bacterium]